MEGSRSRYCAYRLPMIYLSAAGVPYPRARGIARYATVKPIDRATLAATWRMCAGNALCP